MIKHNKPFLCLGLLCVGMSLISCDGISSSSNVHAEVGMTKTEVMNKLGDPSVTNISAGKWYYYGSSFMNKYNEMNELLKSPNEANIIRAQSIQQELEKMTFTCKFIQFDNNDKVSAYLYDTNHKYDEGDDYATWEPKTRSSLEVEGLTSIDCYNAGGKYVSISDESYNYVASYSDGSIVKGIISQNEMTIDNKNNAFFVMWSLHKFDTFTYNANINAYDGRVIVRRDKDVTITGEGLFNVGDRVTLTATIQNGYQFEGWFNTLDELLYSDNTYSFNFPKAGTTYVVANRSLKDYPIIYNLDGGTNSNKNPSSYSIKDSVNFSAPTKEGYSFLGWYTKSDGGKKVETIEAGSTGEIELFARWRFIPVTLVYLDVDKETILYETEVNDGGDIGEIFVGTTPVKESDEDYDYTFEKWSLFKKEDGKHFYIPSFTKSVSLLKLQFALETNYKNKLNAILGEETVSNFSIDYFYLRDVIDYGKTLEASGNITLTEDDSCKSAWFGLPVTDDQYSELDELSFKTYKSGGELREKYSVEQLTYALNLIKDDSITFNYAVKDGAIWDINVLTTAQIENALEEKYLVLINDMFEHEYDARPAEIVDFKYIKVYTHNNYGKCFKIIGTVFGSDNTLPYSAIISISDVDYALITSAFQNNSYITTKNLKANYTKDQLNTLYNIDGHETSTLREHIVDGVVYVVASS